MTSTKSWTCKTTRSAKYARLTQAKYSVEHLKIEYKISKHLKDFFDKKYGPNWHCIVGRFCSAGKNFHAYASYESKNFMFFYEGPIAILLYKLG